MAPNVLAGFFDPPTTDKSIEYLGGIFGNHVGAIYLGGAANPVLIKMFSCFNTVILSIGIIILSYIGLVSTINTAHEGEAMGKKWSSIWLPMRSILGMLLMVPTPAAGYSLIQVIVLWLIIQGIGAADKVWNIALTDLDAGISVTQGLSVDAGSMSSLSSTASNAQGKTLAKKLLYSLACKKSIENLYAGTALNTTTRSNFVAQYGNKIGLLTTDPIFSSSTPAAATYQGSFNIGAQGYGTTAAYQQICGNYKVTGDSKANELSALAASGTVPTAVLENYATTAYETKMLALRAMIPFLDDAAEQIVNNTSNRDGTISTAITAYSDIVQALIVPTNIILSGADPTESAAIEQGRQFGWVTAGSFYFLLAKSVSQKLLATATDFPTPSLVPSTQPSVALAGLNDYLHPNELNYISTNLTKVDEFFANTSNTSAQTTGALTIPDITPDTLAGTIMQPLHDLMQQMVNSITAMMATSGDPLIEHAIFGNNLMLAAEYTWITIIGLVIGLSAAAVCTSSNPFFMILLSVLVVVAPIVIAIMGMLWAFGATLSIYESMIPYLIYAVSVLGWFFLVIEAIIAAPLVALGLVMPSGDELGKIVPSLMLLVNIILRPTLMVFGFILGARLYKVMIEFVNFGMLAAFGSLPSTSFLAPLAALVLYVGFVLTLANKCFALIHIVPDKITRWIGGSTESTDATALQETKASFEKGSGQVNQAARQTANAPGKAVEKAASVAGEVAAIV